MYAITVTLFTVETGSFVKGLVVGLLAASLKTVWAVAHHHLHARLSRSKRRDANGYDPIEMGS